MMTSLDKHDLALRVAERERTIRRQQKLMDERAVILGRLIWSSHRLDDDELTRLRARFMETELEYMVLQAIFETRH